MLRDIEEAWFDAPKEICKYVYSFMKPMPRVLMRMPQRERMSDLCVFNDEWLSQFDLVARTVEYINVQTKEVRKFDVNALQIYHGCAIDVSEEYVKWIDVDGTRRNVLRDGVPIKSRDNSAWIGNITLECRAIMQPDPEPLNLYSPDGMMFTLYRNNIVAYKEVSVDADGVLNAYHVIATLAD